MRFILILFAVLSLFSGNAYSTPDYSKMKKGEEFKLAIGCVANYDLTKVEVQSDDTVRAIISEFAEYSRLSAMALALLENPDKGIDIYKRSYRLNKKALELIDPKIRVAARKKCHDYMPRARLIAETFCKNPNFSDLGSCRSL